MDNTAYLSNNVPFDYKGLLYVLSLKISNNLKIHIIVTAKWLNANITFIHFLKCKS